MERRRRPARLRLAALAVGAAVVVAGCSSGIGRPADAATVGDRAITRGDLDAQLELEREVIESQAGEGIDLENALSFFSGEGADTTPTATAASALTTLVQLAVLEEALADAGGEVTSDQLADARAEIDAQYEAQQASTEGIPAAYLDQQARFQALQVAIQDTIEVSADDLQALYDEQVASLAQVCLSLILVASEDEARAAIARVEEGEDFAAVASEVSLDPGTAAAGGDAGCTAAANAAGQLGPGIFDAAVGDLLEPVQLQQGWVVGLVTDRLVPELADVEDQLLPQLQGAKITDLIEPLLTEVSIDPRFGTWDVTSASVVPPAGPPADVVPAGPEVPAGAEVPAGGEVPAVEPAPGP